MADTAATGAAVSGGVVDASYPTTIPGILQIVELVLGLIAFSCVGAGYWHGAHHFFMFVAVTAWLCSLVMFFLYLFRVPSKVSFPWNFILLIFGFVVTVLYLIADCVLAAFTFGVGRYVAGCLFGWFTLICYAVGTYFAFRAWKDENDGGPVQ